MDVAAIAGRRQRSVTKGLGALLLWLVVLLCGAGGAGAAPTVVSLTSHTYWKLGEGVPTLQLLADRYTPVDTQLIPTGEIAWVAGTPMDFRIARRIERSYDHNWVLNAQGLAAVLRDPASGRTLRVSTTEPGLQVYTHTGVALEPQRFPDSPNQPHFPTAVLRPGQTYRATTTYDFGEAER